jgi:predicted O-linked N-acetylglucosamine transferase (SPINDLY family)
VLHALPASTLLLKSKALGDAATQQALLSEFTRRGIDAARILSEGQSARADYLAAYHRIDIVLDTFPFPGGTTTAEALWMGVPVIGLRGDRLLSRQGESLLVNAGLADWVARDADDFVAIAKARAGAIDAIDALARLRAGLRQRVLASPLFDAARFAAHFETALRGMWTRWCEQRART